MTRRRTREYLHNAAPTLSQMRAQQAYPLREENEPLTVEVVEEFPDRFDL